MAAGVSDDKLEWQGDVLFGTLSTKRNASSSKIYYLFLLLKLYIFFNLSSISKTTGHTLAESTILHILNNLSGLFVTYFKNNQVEPNSKEGYELIKKAFKKFKYQLVWGKKMAWAVCGVSHKYGS